MMWQENAIHLKKVALYSNSIARLRMKNMQRDIRERHSKKIQYQVIQI